MRSNLRDEGRVGGTDDPARVKPLFEFGFEGRDEVDAGPRVGGGGQVAHVVTIVSPRPIGHDGAVDGLTAAGLGLNYDTTRLARTTEDWLIAGSELRDRVAESLETLAEGVELIGSSSVLGLLAKPIVDLAVGLSADQDLSAVTSRLDAAGWIYRGDAGDNGGHVFVLETQPWHRVAHLHVVDYGGRQWRNYLRFRDLLWRSSEARDRYEAVKLRLVQELGNDRKAYTEGKSGVVSSLLDSVE
jgi:GrpB-like predicted nucleotidyltransferase (UPF0157 family)